MVSTRSAGCNDFDIVLCYIARFLPARFRQRCHPRGPVRDLRCVTRWFALIGCASGGAVSTWETHTHPITPPHHPPPTTHSHPPPTHTHHQPPTHTHITTHNPLTPTPTHTHPQPTPTKPTHTLQVVDHVDHVLRQFELPPYYEERCMHASLLSWAHPGGGGGGGVDDDGDAGSGAAVTPSASAVAELQRRVHAVVAMYS